MEGQTGWKLRHIFRNKKVNQVDDHENSSPKEIDEVNFDFNVIRNDKPADYAQLEIFHRAASPIMLLGQCFAVMPLTAIWQANPRFVKFRFKSVQMLITLLFMAASLVLNLSMMKFLVKIGITAKNFVGLVFYTCVQCACILFIDLARHWPPLIRYWTRVELIFNKPPYEVLKRSLSQRVRLSALIIIGCSIVEHALYQTSAVISYTRQAEFCSKFPNSTMGGVSFENYIVMNYSYVFQVLSYNRFVGAYILLVAGTSTFIWNYMDLFIMMISKALAYRFEQISDRVRRLQNEERVPESTFIEIREHYVRMCQLLERVDNALSSIILLSCANNLYFVCVQLLNIFNKFRWPINYIYYWYSMLYLVCRTACVFLTAATINDESKSALAVLRRVSSKNWCVEVERLIFQMSTQTVALSGKKFYFLTRKLLFGMAGTIVTYELVLLQFDEPNRRKGLQPLCA
ncbi:gustatory receptor for sugar taste 64a [Drosophila grimshawi]|uniref:Gustatory receptor n=1 Tax=Drosophila grimshawi TaxID=7222 RepID=B4IYX9_DROGR|nr:gustatory receptor for sugar taste 64a [Drosophila grimshawi]EDV97687.1 GH14559 [Drosophila grimshawi]